MNHDASSYSKHRPLYPSSLFEGLARTGKSDSDLDFHILDLACGSGQSTASLADTLTTSPRTRITACDPDPEMIQAARATHEALADWHVAAAESLPFQDGSFDAVTILSAYHWFDRSRADEEILRVLRPGGRLLIAEYQFPVAPQLPDLNTWIRRGFNETWKFPDQKPRGRLRDFTASLLTHPRIRSSRWDRLVMNQTLSAPELAGLLYSQARFIAHLNTLGSESARLSHQNEVEANLARLLNGQEALFDFRLTRVLATLR